MSVKTSFDHENAWETAKPFIAVLVAFMMIITIIIMAISIQTQDGMNENTRITLAAKMLLPFIFLTISILVIAYIAGGKGWISKRRFVYG